MSRDYPDHYAVEGWFDGEGDCEPPEPGKHWLTITEDGEEYAIVVVRRQPGVSETDPEHVAREAAAWDRAGRVAAALNAYREEV